MTKYVTIKLPEPMIIKIEEIIKDCPELGFTNRTQYITNVLRQKILQCSPEHIFSSRFRKIPNNNSSKNPIDSSQERIPVKRNRGRPRKNN